MGKSASTPPAPDYIGAANAQGAANQQAAQQTGYINNPNIYNPYGSQTVSWGAPNTPGGGGAGGGPAAPVGAPAQQPGAQPSVGGYSDADGIWQPGAPAGGGSATPTGQPVSSGGTQQSNMLQPTITQTLNPQSQAILNAQLGNQLGLQNTATQALGTVQNVMGSPFQYQGPGMQTSLYGNQGGGQGGQPGGGGGNGNMQYINPNMGVQPYGAWDGNPAGVGGSGGGGQPSGGQQQQEGGSFNAQQQQNIPNAPNLGQYGQAQGNNAYSGQINSGPQGNLYGSAMGMAGNSFGQAGGGPSAGQYGLANQNLNTQGIAPIPVNAGMTGQNAIMSRLKPQLEMQNKQFENQLSNQGIMPGSEAYNNAMTTHQQGNNDLLTQAAMQGIGIDMNANQQGFGQALAGGQFGNQAVAQNFGQGQSAQNLQNAAVAQNFGQGFQGQGLTNQAIGQNFGQGLASAGFGNAAQQQAYGQNYGNQQLQNQAIGQNQNAALQQQGAQLGAQNQGFNQALQGAQFGNTAQQQSLQQQLALYNQPLNTISGLMSGAQVQNPQFQQYTGSNVAPAPIMQGVNNQYQGQLQNAAQQNAGNNAFTSGLFDMGAAALPFMKFSDRRLKSNIERIGEHPLGIGIYEYDIFGARDRGVMADEVMTVKPEAVLMHQSGFMMVDYGRL